MALKLKHGDAQLRSSVSSYDLKNVMSWGLFFFFFFNLGISRALFAQMPFIHSPCETYWGLRSVRSTLQESDPLIYRPLIRLALWRFHRANDEISPSFWLSVSLLCQPALPSPGNSVSHSIPHWPPPSPHPALKLWCISWGAYFYPTLPLGLQRRFYLSSEVIVDLSSAERWVWPRCIMHW